MGKFWGYPPTPLKKPIVLESIVPETVDSSLQFYIFIT